jgi:glycosyltransferase involved in cell wall biosynthesis
MKTKKNVLIVLPFNPYPLISGGHQAIFNGISILENIANVYLMVNTTESQYKKGALDALKHKLPYTTIIPFIDPSSKHNIKWYYNVLINKLQLLFPRKKNPVKQEIAKQSTLDPIWDIYVDKQELVKKTIKKYNIDIVQIEMMPDLALVKYLPKNIKKIFVHHEIKFVKDKLFLDSREHFDTDIDVWNSNKCYEIELLNQYDYVITLSKIDSEKLKSEGVTTNIVTSLAVVKDSNVNNNSQPSRKKITYIGPELHYPNYEGVMWFLKNCWHKLLEKDENYTFDIIGKWSNTTIKEIEETYRNVKCVGFVDNLEVALSGTTMVVPLNIGSGIRMKILEAAQYNIPVVTTSVGVEGLPLENGTHVFIADTEESFVDSIIKMEDEYLRQKFVAETKKIIKSNYSIEKLKETRDFLYK